METITEMLFIKKKIVHLRPLKNTDGIYKKYCNYCPRRSR